MANIKNISYNNLSNINTVKLIGQRMRTRRKMLHMTQKCLANQIGLTFKKKQKYEKGITKLSLPNLLKICEVLQCKPDYFFNHLQLSEPDQQISLEDNIEEQLLIIFRKLNSLELKTQIIKLLQTIVHDNKTQEYDK